jgi:hypothetical protein
MMDGGEEEEEVRPKRGKSIRLPEDTDLESQRYCPRIFGFLILGRHCFHLPEPERRCDSQRRIRIKHLLLVLRMTIRLQKS